MYANLWILVADEFYLVILSGRVGCAFSLCAVSTFNTIRILLTRALFFYRQQDFGRMFLCFIRHFFGNFQLSLAGTIFGTLSLNSF